MALKPNAYEILDKIHQKNPKVQILIATKYADISDINTLNQMQLPLIFGENRVQDGKEKQSETQGITTPWHFIGHLQRNKIKYVLPNYDVIQSVDSLRLMTGINQYAEKNKSTASIFLQVNPLEETSKFGFNSKNIVEATDAIDQHHNLKLCGLMCMAPHTENTDIIKKTFQQTRKIYDTIKERGLPITQLSMGMSNDYSIAIDEGSTMIRIGRLIFQ